MKKIGVFTSGGDAPGMNAAIRAVVRMALFNNIQVVGIKQGYAGLINGDVFEMDRRSVSDTIQKGGTILKTARCEEFKTEEGIKKAINVLEVFGIDGVVAIGGDGTFRGASKLNEAGIKVVGIPATIDNDLAYTDFTIGFDTALNTILDAINKIRDTSSSHQRASIVEVMGRSCGDLALYSSIAGGAEKCIIPEKDLDLNEICKLVMSGRNRGKTHNLIILAEGVGNAAELATKIEEKTGIEVRTTILGHIQRGGYPSAQDTILASKMGAKAVEILMNNEFGKVIGIKNGKLFSMNIDEALNKVRVLNEEDYKLAEEISY